MFDLSSAVKGAIKTDQKLFGRVASAVLYNIRTSQRLEAHSLRMKFQVDKSVGSDPNQSTLEIYNLSELSRNFANIPPFLTDKSDLTKTITRADVGKSEKVKVPLDGLYVELYAGYDKFSRIICTGHASGGSLYQKPDWITKLIISDGHINLRYATFEKSYGVGYSIQKVITDVLQSFGLPIGYVMPFITTDIVEYGLALSGQNKKIMDTFAATYNFKWSIQNNSINLFSDDYKIPESVLLTPRSGLISTPVKTDKGLEFDCLIIPLISPGITVRIDGSKTFQGECTVQRVQVTGDTHGSEWKMHVEAKV